jgi:hypothetical protein
VVPINSVMAAHIAFRIATSSYDGLVSHNDVTSEVNFRNTMSLEDFLC